MLRKKERLNRHEFNRFFASGQRYHTPLFTVVYTPYPSFHGSVVVGKKVARGAVERNTVRRRMYAMLRNHPLRTSVGGVVIVIVKKSITTASKVLVREQLDDTLTTIIGRSHQRTHLHS